MNPELFQLLITGILALPANERGLHLLDLVSVVQTACDTDPAAVTFWYQLAPLIERWWLSAVQHGDADLVERTHHFHGLALWIHRDGAQFMSNAETADWAEVVYNNHNLTRS